MPRYTVDLSETAARMIGAEIAAGRTAEAFVEDLLREEQARRDRLDALLDESFDDARSVPVGPGFWEERRRKLHASLAEAVVANE